MLCAMHREHKLFLTFYVTGGIQGRGDSEYREINLGTIFHAAIETTALLYQLVVSFRQKYCDVLLVLPHIMFVEYSVLFFLCSDILDF